MSYVTESNRENNGCDREILAALAFDLEPLSAHDGALVVVGRVVEWWCRVDG